MVIHPKGFLHATVAGRLYEIHMKFTQFALILIQTRNTILVSTFQKKTPS